MLANKELVARARKDSCSGTGVIVVLSVKVIFCAEGAELNNEGTDVGG